MNPYRILLVLVLSVAVPTSALAAVLNTDHCAAMSEAAPASTGEHAGHDMQGMSHAEHMQIEATASADADTLSNACKCGCNCSSTHCVTSASGLISGLWAESELAFSAGAQLNAAVPSRTASAHPFDLLRPPSLT